MSTPTKPISRPVAVLRLPEYQVPKLVTYARSIVRALTGNLQFPSPLPPLATVEAAIDALDAAETDTRTRLRGTVQVRDERRLALVMLLNHLCSHVQATADSDIDNGASIIESAGMAVKRSSTSVRGTIWRPASMFRSCRSRKRPASVLSIDESRRRN
jgi:hypothetical protein